MSTRLLPNENDYISQLPNEVTKTIKFVLFGISYDSFIVSDTRRTIIVRETVSYIVRRYSATRAISV